MPCIHRVDNENFSLGVWEITEPEAILSDGLGINPSGEKYLSEVKSEKRKMEWLATRQLLKLLIGEKQSSVVYDGFGKPALENRQEHISIAHSREFVSVIISPLRIVGIDIEKMDDRIERVAHKFINEQEKTFLPKDFKREAMYIIWGIKETIFKIYSMGELDFRRNMIVEPFEVMQRGIVKARLTKKGFNKKYILNYELNGKWMMVYAIDL